MAYAVIVQPDALRAMSKIPEPDRSRIGRKVEALGENPRPGGMEKLKGPVDLYRIRGGNYRVIYQIHDDVIEVVVIQIGHRKDIYRKMPRLRR
jgi:mRNA interferase RelE/StbE